MTLAFPAPPGDAVDRRPTILVLLGCFSRGVEATGPNQSLLGMVSALPGFRFRVIGKAVPGDIPGRWTELAGVEQLPLAVGRRGAIGLRRAIRSTPHDLLVLNSIFDRQFTIPTLVMRRLGLLPRSPALLAPRGEFSPGVLAIGAHKKAYLRFVRAAGLLDGLALQTTSDREAAEAKAALPYFQGPICIAGNIRTLPPVPRHRPRAEREPLRVAFLSRIDRKKRLDFALTALAAAKCPIEFSIFGPSSHDGYWRACQEQALGMPAHVKVTYRGVIPPSQVLDALAGQDLFFLPTLGENYGHAIIDSLLAGTPVLISDQTPWGDLSERNAGWDLPLDDIAPFVAAIESVAAATPAERDSMRAAARAFGEAALDTERATRATAQCFESLLVAGHAADAPPARAAP